MLQRREAQESNEPYTLATALEATDAPTEQGLEDGRSRETGCNLQRQEGNGRR